MDKDDENWKMWYWGRQLSHELRTTLYALDYLEKQFPDKDYEFRINDKLLGGSRPVNYNDQ